MGKYDLVDGDGLPISKRLRYFDGQFLQDGDFIDEQKYQNDRRQRLARLTVAPGIASGLALTLDRSAASITVSAGTAIDAKGRQIVLPEASRLDLSGRAAGDDLVLAISYSERSSDQSSAGYGSAGDTRFHELPEIAIHTRAQWDAGAGEADGDHPALALGRVVMTQDPSDAARVTFTQESPHATYRVYAGTLLPSTADASIPLRSAGDGEPARAELGGDLRVGSIQIRPGETLAIGDGPPRSGVTLETKGASTKIVTGEGVYLSHSPDASDGLPQARLVESWGPRFDAPSNKFPLSTDNSILVGHQPTGQDWGKGNLYTSGNVGIRRTSADVALHVDGDARLSGSLSLATLKATASAADNGVLYVETPSTTGHRVTDSGSATGLCLRVKDNPPNGDPIFQIRSSGQSPRFFVEQGGYTGSKDNSAWFGGNFDNYLEAPLGIGTSSPAAKLDVRGDVVASGSARVDSGLTVTGATRLNGPLSFDDVNRQTISLWGTVHGIGVQSATTYFRSSNHFGWFKDGAETSSLLDAGTGGTVLMALRDGKLGIGTNDPTQTLDVRGNVTATGSAAVGSGLSVTGALNLNGALQFSNTIQQSISIWDQSYGLGVQHNTMYFRSAAQYGWFKGGSAAGGALDAGTGGTVLMALKDGKLGIGTNSPSEKLDVRGNLTATGSAAVATNLTVGGTASVTGAATVGSLSVTGASPLTGSLSVDGNGSITGTLTVSGVATLASAAKLYALKAEADSGDTGKLLVEAPSARVYGGSGLSVSTGLCLRVATNPADGEPIFQIRSSGQASRFFVEHSGYTGAEDNSAWFGGTKDNYFAGKVGIGTTTPTSTLTVNGSATLGSTTFSSTAAPVLPNGQPPFKWFSYSNFYGSHILTGYNNSDWICTVAGFRSGSGDIDEGGGGSGDTTAIIKVYCAYTSDGQWYVYADFKSHDNQHEDWDVWILAINRKWVG